MTSLARTRSAFRVDRVVEPDASQERYEELFPRWLALASRVADLPDDGYPRPMWHAAGT